MQKRLTFVYQKTRHGRHFIELSVILLSFNRNRHPKGRMEGGWHMENICNYDRTRRNYRCYHFERAGGKCLCIDHYLYKRPCRYAYNCPYYLDREEGEIKEEYTYRHRRGLPIMYPKKPVPPSKKEKPADGKKQREKKKEQERERRRQHGMTEAPKKEIQEINTKIQELRKTFQGKKYKNKGEIRDGKRTVTFTQINGRTFPTYRLEEIALNDKDVVTPVSSQASKNVKIELRKEYGEQMRAKLISQGIIKPAKPE